MNGGSWLLLRVYLFPQLSGDSNIVIAKSDATANDYPPQYEVKG